MKRSEDEEQHERGRRKRRKVRRQGKRRKLKKPERNSVIADGPGAVELRDGDASERKTGSIEDGEKR